MSMTTTAETAEPVREAKKVPAYSVRRLGPNDEAKIIELCSIVFGNTMPSEHWRWQFPNNPFSRPIVYLAETPDGRLVGHYSLIPRPFRDGSRRTLAALSIQSMVHPDFQKQGILKALAAAAEKQLDEDEVNIGITFLNDNSLHAYTQHFGWTELAGPNFILFTVLECGPAIQKILKVEAIARLLAPVANPVARLVFRAQKPREASGRTIRPVERFDERTDALWERFARSIGRGTERSARYLNWRLADKPDHYRMFVAEDDADPGRVSGLVVTKTERKFGLYFGYVAELISIPTTRRRVSPSLPTRSSPSAPRGARWPPRSPPARPACSACSGARASGASRARRCRTESTFATSAARTRPTRAAGHARPTAVSGS